MPAKRTTADPALSPAVKAARHDPTAAEPPDAAPGEANPTSSSVNAAHDAALQLMEAKVSNYFAGSEHEPALELVSDTGGLTGKLAHFRPAQTTPELTTTGSYVCGINLWWLRKGYSPTSWNTALRTR